METLPKDVTVEIALHLKPADIVRFCAGNKKIAQRVCDSKDFWRRKLAQDYPEEMKELKGVIINNPKDVYIKRFSFISKSIEDFIPKYLDIAYGPAAKNLSNLFKMKFYHALYELYTDVSENYHRHKTSPEYIYNTSGLNSDMFMSRRMDPFIPSKLSLEEIRRLPPLIDKLFAAFLMNIRVKDVI